MKNKEKPLVEKKMDFYQDAENKEEPTNDQLLALSLEKKKSSKEEKLPEAFIKVKADFIPLTDVVRLSPDFDTKLPVMMQITAEAEAKENAKKIRTPMDLLFVIDDSGSMGGQKVDLVRESVRYVMKVLNENDRICIVSFDDNGKICTPWHRNTVPENKEKLKAALNDIIGRGGTNIACGMNIGIEMLKRRKYKNPLSFIFLLSDGIDNTPGAEIRIKTYLDESNYKENFIINSFGYKPLFFYLKKN